MVGRRSQPGKGLRLLLRYTPARVPRSDDAPHDAALVPIAVLGAYERARQVPAPFGTGRHRAPRSLARRRPAGMTPTGLDLFLAAVAAVGAGAVNALAGGGTLLTFPTLLALGLPAVTANVTNTVALCPGYLGGALGQASDLSGQRRRLVWLVPAGAAGGVLGGALLLTSGERLFQALVPFLILAACGLLAAQDPIRERLSRRGASSGAHRPREALTWAAVFAASVYGGYFGAGLSVIVLAVLGLAIEETLTRLNAVKQVVGLAVNVAAAALFLTSDHVVWPLAAVMAVGAVVGGAIGGRLASRVPAAVLRRIVVGIGLAVAAACFVR